jgi:hypothetical protein
MLLWVIGAGRATAAEPDPSLTRVGPGAVRTVIPSDYMRAISDITPTKDWSSAFPPEALDAGERGYVTLEFSVSASDQISRCRVIVGTVSSALQSIACAAMSKFAHFRHALDVSGNAIASEAQLYLGFWTEGSQVIPPPPPPRRLTDEGIEIVKSPDWAQVAPEHRGTADVIVELQPTRTASTVRCYPVESSGDKALAYATCNAFQQPGVVRITPVDGSFMQLLQLLVRWDGSHPTYVRPTAKERTPAIIRPADRVIPGFVGTHLTQGRARLTIAPDGAVSECRILLSTGVDRADAAACNHFQHKVRATPATDIFDRKVVDTQVVDLEFAP